MLSRPVRAVFPPACGLRRNAADPRPKRHRLCRWQRCPYSKRDRSRRQGPEDNRPRDHSYPEPSTESTGRQMVAPLRFERHSRGRLGVKQHRENENGEIITLENLDWILREATREHLNPSVLIKHEFDRSWTWRFFAKLGLAAGHYFFGEEFSRSNRAAAL